jgi:hypothetical protein
MRKIVLIFIILTLSLSAHKVELYDGNVIQTDSIFMKGNEIYVDSMKLSRNEVKSIIFEEEQPEALKKEIPDDIQKILEQIPEVYAKYRDFDGVVLRDKGENRLYHYGTRSYRYHFRGLILQDSKRSWANFNRRFFPDMEKITIEKAQVIKPDGIVIPLDMSTIKITKPRREMVFFDKRKTISFTIPNVEVGDIVEYIFTEDVFNPWDRNIFTLNWLFAGNEPVVYSAVDIIIPKDKSLNFKLKNAESALVDSSFIDTCKIYSFEMKNTIPPVEEPLMPAFQDLIPTLHVSTLKSWNYLFDWYSDFQKKRMIITPGIHALADSIVGDAQNEEEKIARLYHWIQRNIRYISIKGAVSSGVSGHKAEVTLENGYGDCTDKSILFSTLLNAIEVEAYPVYLHTHPSPELVKDVPSFWGNHAIVEIFPKEGEPYFLDPVSLHSRYPSFAEMDHGVDAICAQKSSIDFIDVPPSERNQRNYQYDIDVNPDGSSKIKFKSNYTGSYESGIRAFWERLKPDEKIKQFQQMAKRTSPEAELLDYSLLNLEDISKPLIMNIEYSVPDLLQEAGDLYIFELPEIVDRYTRGELSLSERKYDLVYYTSEEIIHTFRIKIPYGWEIEAIPEPLKIKGNQTEYNAGYMFDHNTLIFNDDWKRRGRIIPVDDYSEYRKISNEVLEYVKKPVILRKNGGSR